MSARPTTTHPDPNPLPLRPRVPPANRWPTGSGRRCAVRPSTGGADLTTAIREGDDASVERAVIELSRSRRYLAPLAFLVGAFAMLFEGLRLLFSNWRLTLIEILPAMWIWLAMLDLKAHVLHGKTSTPSAAPSSSRWWPPSSLAHRGRYFLNAVFAFAVAQDGAPEIRPAFATARTTSGTVLAWGSAIGLALGVARGDLPEGGRPWFGLMLSLVVAVMMATYVAVPARLVGHQIPALPERDKLSASVVGGAIGAVVCSPPTPWGALASCCSAPRLLPASGWRSWSSG